MKSRSPSSAKTRGSGSVSGRGATRAGELGLDLGELLPHLRERAVEIGPVEADGGGAPLHLPRLEQPGQRLRHVVEDAGAPLLLGLDRLPALPHAARRVGVRVTEHVRVAADELGVDAARHRLEVADTLLLEQEGEEVGLEQEVAELVEQLGGVTGVGGVGDLVGLLDRVRDDRPRRLLPIPGAVAAEAPRQLLQLDERLGERPSAPEAPAQPVVVAVSVAAAGGANPVA